MTGYSQLRRGSACALAAFRIEAWNMQMDAHHDLAGAADSVYGC
jgi:hypothetical protein